ncbi:hypothetical protein GALMADRAFT_143942 [Galerina marginata CBS 339.88]|uniref:Uncharacterized protein n=1 Tax=Galerina marginata (strain CBS 339.88) TaxID=685588 RepID=A0A067SK03_GALM3|nr:hypothetical protein GALMADRAFT_143942 [Galerina marginata CBS 339.88]
MHPNDNPRPKNWLITHLADDIWRTIFKLCVVHHESRLTRFGHQIHILSSQVCSRWRRIAINAPELWNKIHLHVNELGTRSLGPEFLDLHLQRARSSPLRISLMADVYLVRPKGDHRTSRELETCRMIELLCRNFHLANDLEIGTYVFNCGMPQLPHGSLLDCVLPVALPLLQKLTLKIGKTVTSMNPGMSKLWTRSPNLKSIAFAHSNLFFDRCSFNHTYMAGKLQIPFVQLTSVDISLYTPEHHLYDLLSNSKDLACCVVRLCQFSWDTPFMKNCEPLNLPVLQCLKLVTTYDPTNLVYFLLFINTPALTSLALETPSIDWRHAHFASFLASSSCNIQKFSVKICGRTSPEMLDSLRLLPQLSSLTLNLDNISDGGGGAFRCDLRRQFYTRFVTEMDQWDEVTQQFTLLPALRKLRIAVLIPRPPAFVAMALGRKLEVDLLGFTP